MLLDQAMLEVFPELAVTSDSTTSEW